MQTVQHDFTWRRSIVAAVWNRKTVFPGSLLALTLVSVVPGIDELFRIDVAILPMLIGGGFITYQTVVATIENRRLTAGALVVLALIGTAYIEEYIAGAVVAFMMISGEWLEDVTLEKTRNAVRALVRLTPDEATVFENGDWTRKPLRDVKLGDRVLIRPGERVPVDGKIASGHATFDESSLTGESVPVERTDGDPIFAGTVNTSGAVEATVEKIGSETALGKIIRIVHEAQERKGTTQKAADRFAMYFTPLILLICAGVWFLTSDLVRVMAVLVIACPCALVLATPTAVVAAVGNAAKRGVLIKGGLVLEQLGRVDTVCFDKTGTLTQGRLEVVETFGFGDGDASQTLALARAVETRSEHPIARAVIEAADKAARGVKRLDATDFEQVFGVGVRGQVGDDDVWVGNRRVLERAAPRKRLDEAEQFFTEQAGKGRTALVVIRNGVCVGGIAVADTLRSDAPEAVESLRKTGISRIVMLTGDQDTTGRAIGSQVGIDEIETELMPEAKLTVVERLKAEGRVVAMVGDGVNDAPALMLADVGIAMGAAGTDVAIESSGMALMGEDLGVLVDMVALGKRTLSIIRQNIWVFAVGVNIVGIALAGSGYLGPVMAAVVHNISSVFVVLNSARLLSFRAT